MIDPSIIEQVRQRSNIVDIIGSYLPLKASGPNNKGCCPFHEEKSASFNVNAAKQTYHCFGCGAGGDVFKFLMELEGLSFPEAVRRVGERVGIEVEDRELTPKEKKQLSERDRILEINALANEFYQHNFATQNTAGSLIDLELKKMGIDESILQEFGFGYALDQWSSLLKNLKSKGVSIEEMLAAGLIQQRKDKKGYYDILRNRMVEPINDGEGRIIGFVGKALDDSSKLKFLCSANSLVFDREKSLFGLFRAKTSIRKQSAVIVVQGIADLFALRRAGFDNVVTTCGGVLNMHHAYQLKRLASKVYLVYSQRAWSSQRAFEDMSPLLELGMSVAGVELGEKEWLSRLLKTDEATGFKDLIAKAEPLLETYVRTSLGNLSSNIDQAKEVVKGVVEKVRLVPSILERSLYAKEVARCTPFRESDLVDAVLKEAA